MKLEAGYLEIYDLDKVKSYQAANEVLKMCERAGLRKFAPTKERTDTDDKR